MHLRVLRTNTSIKRQPYSRHIPHSECIRKIVKTYLTNNLLIVDFTKKFCNYSDPFWPLCGHLKSVCLAKLIFKQKMNNILKKAGSLSNALVFAPMK